MFDPDPPVAARIGPSHQWQIPLLAISASLLVVVVLRLRPPEVSLTFDERLVQLRSLMASGLHNLVVQDASDLLARPDLATDRAAALHALIAEATYESEVGRSVHNTDYALGILRSLALAEASGWAMTAADWRRSGFAWEWLSRTDRALGDFERALSLGVAEEGSLRRHMVELQTHRGELTPDEHLAILDRYLERVGDDAANLFWAVRNKIELLIELARYGEAKETIASVLPAFQNRQELRELEYYSAWLLYRQDRTDEAERELRALRARLERADDVYGRAGWLLGNLNLSNDRPVDALAFFRDIVGSFPSGPYYAACLLGSAEAQAQLQEYDKSAELFRLLIGGLPFEFRSELISEETIRTSLMVLYEKLRNEEVYRESLTFIELADLVAHDSEAGVRSQYVERLAWAHVLVGESYETEADSMLDADPGATVDSSGEVNEEDDSESEAGEPGNEEPSAVALMRKHYAAAAKSFASLAALLPYEEDGSADALWNAADHFDRAGETLETIDILEEFVRTRISSSQLPLALLRLGRSYQSLNDYVNAIEAYEANLLEYPRTPPAIGSVVPLAQCYLARGEEYFEQAEQVLLSLVNQTGEEQAPITPAAREYRQALFLLGEMYVGHDDYEKAIRVLEEAVARYPDDVGTGTAKFLLANSYRLSSLALRAEGDREEAAAFRQRLASEVVRRLTRAHDLFSELAAELGPGGSDNAEGVRPEYVRLALFYQADCLFDLGRFGQALPLYEEAAWKYHDTPAALSASVQILNCYQRMGRTDEARTALQRARQLVGRIPQERFTLLDSGMSKKQWEDYLGRVGSSALFR